MCDTCRTELNLTPNGIDEDRYLWSCFLFFAQMSGRWDQLSKRNYAPDRKRRAEAKILLLQIARLPRATRGDRYAGWLAGHDPAQ